MNWTAYMIFAVVIGGLGTIEGPIVGTLLFFVLRELLSDYGLVGERFDLRFFPVQRRVRFTAPTGVAADTRR